ncbi:peptidoglycan-binding protein [Planomonospora corallina]|uniref:Peptidoglycan-binding protein n=1 Tax=Planomonospora corallina TaxID=1806052 RepID=A0ABV8I735_9ACTN
MGRTARTVAIAALTGLGACGGAVPGAAADAPRGSAAPEPSGAPPPPDALSSQGPPPPAALSFQDVPASRPSAEVLRRPTLRPGDSGRWVDTLQSRLARLGYWLGAADGRFGPLTVQAVHALQKAAGLGRDGVVGPGTWDALERGARPDARGAHGRRVEVSLDRQLLMLVEDGQVKRILNTSTGSGAPYRVDGVREEAVTPPGVYRVHRRVDGWDSGPTGDLYRPAYFNGGIAVHGYGSVPPRPASHGCVRVSPAAMDSLWRSGWLDHGDVVQVY